MDATIQRARAGGWLERALQVAGDSTGLESRHVSRYYAFRRGQRIRLERYLKVSAVCDCRTHLFVSVRVTRGPCSDLCEGPYILQAARRRTRLRQVLLDAGYDAEKTHLLIRQLGASSVIPAKRGRPTDKLPTGLYRRLMKQYFPADVYGQRWQIESVFSRHKRRLRSELRATTWTMQKVEAYLRILVHNLMILLSKANFSTEQQTAVFFAATPYANCSRRLAIIRANFGKSLRAPARIDRRVTRRSGVGGWV